MLGYPAIANRQSNQRFLPVWSCLLLLGLLSACGQTGPSSTNEPPSSETPTDTSQPTTGGATSSAETQGIDVSHFQGAVDWSKVAKTDKAFAFIKATEGIDYVDPLFESHWQGIQKVDLLRGAYHFFVPHDDAKTQADFFLATVSLESGDLIPVLDVESQGGVSTEVLLQGVQTWLDVVEQALGVKPMIYTAPNFWNSLQSTTFSDYPLWIAEYSEETPTVPNGWDAWTLWQQSQQGTVEGVEKEVDLSVFEGSLEELKQQLTIPVTTSKDP